MLRLDGFSVLSFCICVVALFLGFHGELFFLRRSLGQSQCAQMLVTARLPT
jgi:hypothetical protein